MNSRLCAPMLCAASLATLMTHAIFADFYKNVSTATDQLHTRIGEATQEPCALLSGYVRKPFHDVGKRIAPHIPDTRPDIILPLASLVLYIASSQIISGIVEAKAEEAQAAGIERPSTHPHVKTGINLFKIAVGAASFNETWKKKNDPVDWALKNSISTLLMTSGAYSIYRTYKPLRNA
jgi:hypothetical protein